MKRLSAPQMISRPDNASSIVNTGGSGSISMVTLRRASWSSTGSAWASSSTGSSAWFTRPGGEVRLIVGDERHDVGAGDVAGGDDRDRVPGNARAVSDVANHAPRRRAAHRDAVEHAGQPQIVDVARLAGDLRASFLAWDRLPDGWHERILTCPGRGAQTRSEVPEVTEATDSKHGGTEERRNGELFCICVLRYSVTPFLRVKTSGVSVLSVISSDRETRTASPACAPSRTSPG